MIGRPLPQDERSKDFPNLTDENHLITSVATENYNCIAWAYEVSNRRMWPGTQDYHWPSPVAGPDDLRTLMQLFLNAGYDECENGELEEGFKKIAIYMNQEGPQHAARQMESGRWTSKLGSGEDIEHDTLEALEGECYGKAIVFLKKRIV